LLLELRVENYAVIDNAVVEFARGLSLLTGETGAGKSILIDALALLLGERASADVIRHGAEKAAVGGVFQATERARQILEENGVETADDEIIVRREVGASGKGRVFINNQPATVAVLKQLAPELATIHAQNESLLAFGAAERRRLLDRSCGVSTEAAAESFEKYREFAQRISELEQNEQDRLRLVDLWSFQSKEVEQAHLEAGEDARLEAEKRVLANSEKLQAAAKSAHEVLYEANSSAASSIRSAIKNLEELCRYDARFQEQLASLESSRIAVEDVGASLRDYAESIDASPERLGEIESRLALLDRLKRKYGQTLEEVIGFGAEAARKLNEIENRDELSRELQKQLTAASEEYLKQARALSRKRVELAKRLEKQVEAEIRELAINGRFRIEVSASEEPANWGAEGFDAVNYLVSTNPGEPMHPVEQVASGGELSRVMLALKAALEREAPVKSRSKATGQELKTLVFDEIDAGIGGSAAEAVGKKLRALSASHQVLCITHLPQIACFANQHYVIEKRERREGGGTRVRTSIRRLSEPERAQEIARMLSGAEVTDTSLRHAEQMLKTRS